MRGAGKGIRGMADLEFKAVMGIVAIILSAGSIFANFLLIDMYCTHMEWEDTKNWELTRKDEIERIEKQMERHRRETIRKWYKDVKGERR